MMTTIRIYYTFAIVVVCILIYVTTRKTEQFLDFKELNREPILHHRLLYTAKPVINLQYSPESTLNSLSKFMQQRNSLLKANADLNDAIQWQLTDVVSYKPSANNVAITMCDRGKHVLFVANKKNNPITQLRDCKGKRIGVSGAVGMRIANALLQTYDIRKSENTFVNLSMPQLFDALFKDNTIDVALLYITDSSPYMKQLLDNQMQLVEYNDINMNTVKIWLPYARKSLMLMTLVVDKRNPPKAAAESIQTYALEMDMVICGSPDVDHPYIDDLVDFMGAYSKNNYYTQYLPFHSHTLDMLRQYNKSMAGKMRLLEGFASAHNAESRDLQALATVGHNVDGKYHYDPATDIHVMVLQGLVRFNGITVQRNDRIILANQQNTSENNYYYVTSADHLQTVLMTRLLMKPSNDIPLYEGDKLIIQDNSSYKLGTVVKGQIITQPLNPKTSFANAACFQNILYKTQDECERPVDAFGKPKPIYTWDAPCTYDSECPFYKFGSNRGKCVQGFCELPLGAVRLSHRKYDKEKSKLLCIGCDDPEDVECCRNKELAF